MLSTIKDWLGINRYVVRYDFPSKVLPGRRNRGKWGTFTKRHAESFCRTARRSFPGKYWVERDETG